MILYACHNPERGCGFVRDGQSRKYLGLLYLVACHSVPITIITFLPSLPLRRALKVTLSYHPYESAKC